MPRNPARRSSRPARKRRLLSKRFYSRLRILSMGLLLFLGSLLIGGAMLLILAFRTPFAKADSFGEIFTENSSKYTLLLMSVDSREGSSPHIESINLFSLNPQSKTAVMISIPSELKLNNLAEFGEISLSSLYAVGSGNDPDHTKSITTVSDTLENILAIPIDKYIITDQKGLKNIEDEANMELTWSNFNELLSLRELLRFPNLVTTLHSSLASDLSFQELTTLGKLLLSIREDKITKLELREEDFKEISILDRKLAGNVFDPQIYEERLSIQVLNGTTIPAQAQQASRLIQNMGGRVVDTGNTTDQNSERSYILVRNESSYTLSKISKVLGINTIRVYNSSYGIKDRADISVIVGLDTASKK